MHPLFFFALAATVLAGAGQAAAQGVQVAPVVVELASGQMATTIAVTNTGGSGVTVQVRPFAWDQAGEADRLSPTQDIVVSPPITEIGAGETQTYRIVTRKSSGPVEAAYRLLVDQIPSSLATTGVQFALRLSLPLFLEPPGRAVPSVEWRITSDGRAATLRATNKGNSRTRLLSPELVAGLRHLSLVPNGNPYILPQVERSWRIVGPGAPAAGTVVRLTGLSDAGRVDAAVPVSAP